MIWILFVPMAFIGLMYLIFSSASAQSSAEQKWIAGIRVHHRFPSIIHDKIIALGFDPETKKIGVFRRVGQGYILSTDHVAAVELTPIYETEIESSGKSRTSRGSQIISAGVGAAIAGPAGLLIGGLSGNTRTETHTTSHQRLVSMELNVRFLSDEVPMALIVTPMIDDAREMAARFANAIDLRSNRAIDLPAAEIVQTPTLSDDEFIALKEAGLVRRGWWARTFGA